MTQSITRVQDVRTMEHGKHVLLAAPAVSLPVIKQENVVLWNGELPHIGHRDLDTEV